MDLEKHTEVRKWLTDIFGPQGVPEYEICDRTTEVLHSIMKHNQDCDEDCQILIEDGKKKGVQYETEATRIKDVLKSVSMTPDSLPPDVSGQLEALVDVAQQLDVQKVDVASLSIGLFELLKESAASKRQASRAEFEVDKLAKKVQSSSLINEQLQESLKLARRNVQVEEEKVSGYEKTVESSKKQIQHYEATNKHYETILSKHGFSTSITHEELLKKNQHLKALEEEFNTLKVKLDSYYDLPTDPNLLAEKISEAKAQLNDIEDTIQMHYQQEQFQYQ